MFKSATYHRLYISAFLLLLLVSAAGQKVFAQEKEIVDSLGNLSDVTQIDDDDYINMVLPPLSELLKAALNAPSVELLRSSKREQEESLGLVKKEWLSYIRALGNYSYGSMGSTTETTASGTSSYYQFTGEVQSLYNIGAGLTIPLDLLFNRKTKIKIQKERIEQVDYQIQQAIEERKIMIIETYAEAVQYLHTVKSMAENMALANSEIKMNEIGYLEGTVQFSELSGKKRTQSEALLSYEIAKSNLNKTLLRLELLTEVKIIKK
jgi:outer membrane protein TolC